MSSVIISLRLGSWLHISLPSSPWYSLLRKWFSWLCKEDLLSSAYTESKLGSRVCPWRQKLPDASLLLSFLSLGAHCSPFLPNQGVPRVILPPATLLTENQSAVGIDGSREVSLP